MTAGTTAVIKIKQCGVARGTKWRKANQVLVAGWKWNFRPLGELVKVNRCAAFGAIDSSSSPHIIENAE